MTERPSEPELFRRAVAALKSAPARPEILLTELAPPKRRAPWAFALSAEVTSSADVLSIGRLFLLHDEDQAQLWQGTLRLVAYLRVELDSELAADPLLPEVGWSWLVEALETSQARFAALGGTVTQTSSARFGHIDGTPRTDDLELRASWTAPDAELGAHGTAFYQLLAVAVGLPPRGVASIR